MFNPKKISQIKILSFFENFKKIQLKLGAINNQSPIIVLEELVSIFLELQEYGDPHNPDQKSDVR